MKRPILFFVLSLIGLVQCSAQTFDIPSVNEWQTYFKNREAGIKDKLHKLIIAGKLKAYQTDSLKSTYSVNTLKERGQTRLSSDEKDTFFAFDISQSKNLWFKKRIKTSPYEALETTELSAIAITFAPFILGFPTPDIPWCWLRPSEVKAVLTPDEYKWLQLMYYYAKNDNYAVARDTIYGDVYWDINHTKNAFTIYQTDTSLIYNISRSLRLSNFYTETDLYDYYGRLFPLKPFLYDVQKKTKLTLSQFEKTYQEEYVIFIQTDALDPTIGMDSIITVPYRITHFHSLEYNPKGGKLTGYNIEFPHFINNQPDTIKFFISSEDLKIMGSIPTVFWFYEDYFRWKLK